MERNKRSTTKGRPAKAKVARPSKKKRATRTKGTQKAINNEKSVRKSILNRGEVQRINTIFYPVTSTEQFDIKNPLFIEVEDLRKKSLILHPITENDAAKLDSLTKEIDLIKTQMKESKDQKELFDLGSEAEELNKMYIEKRRVL